MEKEIQNEKISGTIGRSQGPFLKNRAPDEAHTGLGNLMMGGLLDTEGDCCW